MSESERRQPHTEYLAKPSYSFLLTIAEGNSGITRLWHHNLLGIDVVSKTDSYLGRGGLAKSEPRTLLKVKHTRIVELFEAQYEPDKDPSLQLITFTMRYCEGRSVHTALEEGHHFSVNETCAVLSDVLDALAYMHEEHDYLHRDVKPGNVMLDAERRRGFLGDLGSAEEMAGTGSTSPHGGTALYRPPEAVTKAVTVQSDLYSVGMVGLEMINGALPYETLDAEGIDSRLADGRRAVVDRLFAPEPWVPPGLSKLLRSLTAADPAERPDSAAAALRAIRGTACVDWRRVEGVGYEGAWRGSWPPRLPIARRRHYEVTTELIRGGPNRGRLRLRVASRMAGTQWRHIHGLERVVDQNDKAALARFFRSVEAHATAAR